MDGVEMGPMWEYTTKGVHSPQVRLRWKIGRKKLSKYTLKVE